MGFSGTWSGSATANIQGDAPYTYTGQIVVSVGGQTANVSEVCPNGDGSFAASGSDDSASWSGTLACSAVALEGCGAVVFTYTSGSLSLGGNMLAASGAGSGTGCGITNSFTMSFTGTK
jgi:hypothetical protein